MVENPSKIWVNLSTKITIARKTKIWNLIFISIQSIPDLLKWNLPAYEWIGYLLLSIYNPSNNHPSPPQRHLPSHGPNGCQLLWAPRQPCRCGPPTCGGHLRRVKLHRECFFSFYKEKSFRNQMVFAIFRLI